MQDDKKPGAVKQNASTTVLLSREKTKEMRFLGSEGGSGVRTKGEREGGKRKERE